MKEQKTLRNWRESRSWTLQQLAERTQANSYSGQHISAVERGAARATDDFLKEMGRILEIDPDQILPSGGAEPRESSPVSELEVWKTRAKNAEKKLADIRSGLRHLMQVSADTPLPDDDTGLLPGTNSKAVSDAGRASLVAGVREIQELQRTPPTDAPSDDKASPGRGAQKDAKSQRGPQVPAPDEPAHG